MRNTGRILNEVSREVSNILYKYDKQKLSRYLKYSCSVDKAHLLMLYSKKLIGKQEIKKLLSLIQILESSGFKNLNFKKITRGPFTLYEDFIISRIGKDAGGVLQLGRSRNDLNATISLLRFRDTYSNIISEILQLERTLIQLAKKYQIPMPAYTHYQPAVPITYSHWILGFSYNLERLLTDFLELKNEIQLCPLGACSVGGTTIQIDSKMTSKLLGFDSPYSNSVDAIASRNWLLKYLALLAIMANTLGRIANQFLLFTTQEFNFFDLPDKIIGGSSLMPNKRNPFLLEHIIGKCGKVSGIFNTAAFAMHGTPFSNSIAVSSEAEEFLEAATFNILDSIHLFTAFIKAAKPKKENMIRSSKLGFIEATEIANQLVLKKKISFREAHTLVGEQIRKTIKKGETTIGNSAFKGHGLENSYELFSIENIIGRSNYGGGPGSKSVENQIRKLSSKIKSGTDRLNKLQRKWKLANSTLNNKVLKIINE